MLLTNLTPLGFWIASAMGATEGKIAKEFDLGRVLLAIVIVLMAAKIGGDLAERLRQPAVLGELVMGVVLGNLGLLGFHSLEFLKTDPAVSVLAGIGVVLLLFQVGLESNLGEMLRVGFSSFLVAVAGVITPFALGWGVGRWFYPEENSLVHVFLGATLTATSVGITARVLGDLGKTKSTEGKIILGAAVIDDVLGLVILAAVTGMIAAANQGSASLPLSTIGWVVAKATLFLLGAILFGRLVSPSLFTLASRLRTRGMLLATSMSFCCLFAYLADAASLAPIVGAFAAGLILDPVHYRDFTQRGEHSIEELIEPVTSLLVPIFFVLMGARVELSSFGQTELWGFAAALTAAAVVGKQACSLGVLERGVNRLAVGLGMIPRGEVGLIFASIGAGMVLAGEPVITPAIYASVVMMVIITTLMTPPLLKFSLSRTRQVNVTSPS